MAPVTMQIVLQRIKNPSLWLSGLGLVFLCGCGPGKEEIVQQKVFERVNAFRIKRIAECRENLLQEAGKTADSLLLSEARQELIDSLSRMKPGRPIKPIPVLPIDSLQIKPIFEL